MKHKYKIRQKIYVPRTPSIGHYVEYYDYIGLVVGYVENYSRMPEHYRQYYLRHGFEYVCAQVTPDCGGGHLIGAADVFKEEELVKYKGRSLDWMFYDFIHYDDYLEEELEKMSMVFLDGTLISLFNSGKCIITRQKNVKCLSTTRKKENMNSLPIKTETNAELKTRKRKEQKYL